MQIVRKLDDTHNEVYLHDEDVFRVREKVISVMKNELPGDRFKFCVNSKNRYKICE